MRLAALFLICLLPLAAAAQPDLSGLPLDGVVELEAERLVRDETGIVRAEGNVRLSVGPILLGADAVTYDPATGTAQLLGRVTLLEGRYAARADRIALNLREGTGALSEAAIFEKTAAIPVGEAFDAPDADALSALGVNALEVRSEQVARLADGTYVAAHPTVTTCDCGDDPPSWRIGASEAAIIPGERVRLTWPVLYAQSVPIAAFPYFSIPLSQRKSGLLLPDVSLFDTLGVLDFMQPLYLVLGRSYDATLSVGYATGNEKDVTPVDPDDEAGQRDSSFRGPRTSAEFRYAPRIGTGGRLFGAYSYDLSSFEERKEVTKGPVPNNRHRWALEWDHADDWPAAFDDRVDLALVSDRAYVKDFNDDVILGQEQVLRSSAWAAKREGPALFALEAVYLQDLRPVVQPRPGETSEIPNTDSRLWGSGGRNTFQRVPGVAIDLARLPLPFGAGLALQSGVVRFQPFSDPNFGDEGRDGLAPGDPDYLGPDADGSEGDGVLQPGERPSITRIALRPTLTLPLILGRYLSVTPYAGWREQLYYNEPGVRGYAGWGVFGGEAHTEIARTFDGQVRHAWIPQLELRRLVPAHDEDAPLRPYDELDVRPLAPVTEGRAALASRLDFALGDGSTGDLVATVGQDFLLDPDAERVELFARLEASMFPVDFDGTVRFDEAGQLTEASAGGALSDRRGDQLRAGVLRLAPGGSARLRAGPDDLFDSGFSTEISPPGTVEQVTQVRAGATVVPTEGLSLSYDFILVPTFERAKFQEQSARLAYVSRCDCWSASVRVTFRRNTDGEVQDFPSINPSVELGGLVSF